jgi:hypothetical protein
MNVAANVFVCVVKDLVFVVVLQPAIGGEAVHMSLGTGKLLNDRDAAGGVFDAWPERRLNFAPTIPVVFDFRLEIGVLDFA